MSGPTTPTNGRSFGITVLAVLALFYTLYFARAFLLPIAFALLLDFLFSPAVRALASRHSRSCAITSRRSPRSASSWAGAPRPSAAP